MEVFVTAKCPKFCTVITHEVVNSFERQTNGKVPCVKKKRLGVSVVVWGVSVVATLNMVGRYWVAISGRGHLLRLL